MMVQVNQAAEGMVEIGFEGDWEWLWSPLLDAGEAAELGRWLTVWVNDRPAYSELTLALSICTRNWFSRTLILLANS
jgi:hypothetical protein